MRNCNQLSEKRTLLILIKVEFFLFNTAEVGETSELEYGVTIKKEQRRV